MTATGSPAYAKSPQVRLPGVPKAVQAIGVNTAVGVSWTAPVNKGGDINLFYVVTVSKTVVPCTFTANTACTVSGLTNGKSYTVSVRAFNSKGEGHSSRKVKVTPTTAQDCSYVDPYANLQGCTLNSLDASDGNLTGANLTGANLSGANLSGANLTGANLTDANLTDANLACVRVPPQLPQLVCAELTDATLSGASFSNASLIGVSSGGITGVPSVLPPQWSLVAGYLLGPDATLPDAYLVDANLTGANLSGANLSLANLTGANLTDVDLSGASLGTLTSVTWSNTTCPDGTNSDNDGDTCVNDLW
jgi:uncharacterized protein YjbI with pentapeptide repeats